MDGALHHIEIYVSNLKKTTQMWKWLLTKKFSYTISAKWDGGISFKLANTYIVFVQTEKKHLDSAYHRKKTGLNHLAFHCSSREFVDTLTKELKKRNSHLVCRQTSVCRRSGLLRSIF
jgi:catechol-2,3-dioxygenase